MGLTIANPHHSPSPSPLTPIPNPYPYPQVGLTIVDDGARLELYVRDTQNHRVQVKG